LGRERLEYFQQTAFQAHARLGTGNLYHWYHVTRVTRYLQAGAAAPATPRRCGGVSVHAEGVRRGRARSERAEPDRLQPRELPRPVGGVDRRGTRGLRAPLGPLQGVQVCRTSDGQYDRGFAEGIVAGRHAPAAGDDLVGFVSVDRLGTRSGARE